MAVEPLGNQKILDADLVDWRMLAQAFHARFLTGEFGRGLRFVTAVGDVAEAAGHYPEVTLTDQWVDMRLISHDAVFRPDDAGPEIRVSYVTQRDVDLARRISEIAGDQGVAAEPSVATQLELALDTPDGAATGPFWAALLTGTSESGQRDEIRDPTRQVPNLRFQGADVDDPARQRFHIDLFVAPEVAEQRIAAAVAAGGRVVSDDEAPSFVVLADPDGNKVCVCTFLMPSK